jgi:arylformamidase
MIYRGMDQASLDAAYNNSAAVGLRQQTLVADWKARSEAIAREIPVKRDLRYGEGPRQRFDFFPCGEKGAPTLLFVHGGYWQMGDKEQFSFIAAGPLFHGVNVAAVEYSLAPAVRMDGIVAEIRLAIAWIIRHLGDLDAATDGVYVSGHSAGGHLTAMMMAEPGIKGAIAISGLFDLEPIRLCYLNHKLGMDGADAQRNSPILHLPEKAPPLIVAVGGSELPELRRQSKEYARAWTASGLEGQFLSLSGHDLSAFSRSLLAPQASSPRRSWSWWQKAGSGFYFTDERSRRGQARRRARTMKCRGARHP